MWIRKQEPVNGSTPEENTTTAITATAGALLLPHTIITTIQITGQTIIPGLIHLQPIRLPVEAKVQALLLVARAEVKLLPNQSAQMRKPVSFIRTVPECTSFIKFFQI